MLPRDFFHHCARCGARQPAAPTGNVFTCVECGFRLFFNPAVAAAALILDPRGWVLCMRRARDPQRGKLAFPGGFIDIGESAEDALRREIREEVGLEVGALEFLCSSQHEYLYDTVSYPVLDLIFLTRAQTTEGISDPAEVTDVQWIEPTRIEPAELAFPSLRQGLKIVLQGHGR